MWRVTQPDPDRCNVHGALVGERSLIVADSDGAELLGSAVLLAVVLAEGRWLLSLADLRSYSQSLRLKMR